MSNRMSTFSVGSDSPGPRGPGQQSSQVSTTTLLNAIHNSYLSSQTYQLDVGTSLVVNTWLTAAQAGPDRSIGGTVDANLAARAWEHARRRAEDGCIVLGSLHNSTPSVLVPFLQALPLSIPTSLCTGLEALQPMLRCITPHNPSVPRQSGLGVTLNLDLAGNLTGAFLGLSQGGIDTKKGLLDIPAEAGYRAFDVFYYLLTSASTPAEREFLGLKAASSYSLLSKSRTYTPPSYLPTADDAASADDFRSALKEIGIKGSIHRSFISTLAGLLKLGNTLDYQADADELDEIYEDVSGLLGMDPEVLARQCTTEERHTFIGGLYEALVDWVIKKANAAIADQMNPGAADVGDTCCITVLEIPDPTLGKAMCLRGVFDDSQGINAEMKEDGLQLSQPGSSVVREMQNAVSEVAPDLGIMNGPAGREKQYELEKREEVLEKIGFAADSDGFLKRLLFPVEGEGINLGRNGRMDIPSLLNSSRVWYHLSIHPTDDSPASLAALPSVTSAWSAGTVSRQLRAWRLPEWANRRNKNIDYTVDFDFDEFVRRYQPLGCMDGRDGIDSWILERGWSNGEVIVGRDRVWMRENAWWEVESFLDLRPGVDNGVAPMPGNMSMSGGAVHMVAPPTGMETGYSNASGYFPNHLGDDLSNGSRDHLLHQRNQSQLTLGQSPLAAPSIAASGMRKSALGDYGLGTKGDTFKEDVFYNADGDFVNNLDPELAKNKTIETSKVTLGRRVWVAVVWAITFWIPSPLLRYVGRMRRPDVRMAWREKFVLCFIILLFNAIIVFWIIWFGKLLCPNFDKAWAADELLAHTADNDFWVAVHGKVYDITKFWRLDHSDSSAISVTEDAMEPLAGLDLSDYFPIPLTLGCKGLVTDESVLVRPNETAEYGNADHRSGYQATYSSTDLANNDWYETNFLPRMKDYYKGDMVVDPALVSEDGSVNSHPWAIYNKEVIDLNYYFYTQDLMDGNKAYSYLDEDLTSIVEENPGTDVTELWDAVFESKKGNSTAYAQAVNSLTCMRTVFYTGLKDFRYTARCQVNNYILLAFTVIICCVILVKFLAALQLGSKRRPSPQDKFVICQVPAYTEGEDSLRKALDSLTALQYDNKRKLICVICDGVIVGEGNDRPTPKIVLDILGVDPKVDPPALPFKSVGTGGEQLNFGKVYSGLYEYEGNVVPYLVIVKVGRDKEQSKSKPGNRGKRDSQILLMSFLNRIHHRSPMNPLELEMFHQINNIIGVDPELYEYLLMVDADTCVREDALNRLVARCVKDSKIAGICGETSLQNEERSWWTMIQVYEYFISHNLAKAFESLFGSVTCLPGCFTMYRLRTADKGKPLIVSDAVINDYSDCYVDTLHKKNLLSLGEDRYLTTLMTKHFPQMSYKFTADAYCQTAAPETWSVLLSQRRRWINSTIHNLVELMRLKDMCGFCCFSMRFVVFIDLFGTIILPATCVYLGWLIYRLATNTGVFPLISLIMLAAVYGLQALIFIIKRQWQHIGWMIIYIIAFPIYSFVLPIYSFWNQDNFSWGNTRVVIGEKGDKKVVALDGEDPFDPRAIPLQRWDDYALQSNLPGRRGGHSDKFAEAGYDENYEMDDMKSVYSSVRQPSVLAGTPGRQSYMPPQSPAPFLAPNMGGRASTMGMSTMGMSTYGADPMGRQSMVSLGGGIGRMQSPYQDFPAQQRGSMANLRPQSTSPGVGLQHRGSAMFTSGARTPIPGGEHMRSQSSFDFQRGNVGPDDLMIVDAIRGVLAEVDLDTVTKKQVRALVEQRLQHELTGEKKAFMDRQIDTELANM
ncbi:putative chitin synthase protein [Zalerion maritima]|uniref:chitin synthase n=1 Tax=Zalerion maritima TaxID=339359 RepID=A0AAD5S031_9PEZI|nr:putative chitin synthase protein [Zalerion maritima]